MAKGVLGVFKARFDKHYNPSWSAALLLDPAWFQLTEGGWKTALLSNDEYKDAKVRLP